MSGERVGFPRTRGNLIVISGPSGSGKNSVLARVRESVPNLTYSISATTRAPREGELDGVHYFFVKHDEFVLRMEAGEFLEMAEFCGNYYGTPRSLIERSLSAGEDVIMDIEIRGADQVRAAMPDAVFIFLVPPSYAELRARIERRGSESREAVERRLAKAVEEIPAVFRYDYVVMNHDLNRAVDQIRSIILAERARVSRCDCACFVRRFASESPN
ncbi:MAG: guanylate kinase [Firmicutes bacterium]|jgi:guanylate kinase|nr:guanylate kinase [Bacillota bacterium]